MALRVFSPAFLAQQRVGSEFLTAAAAAAAAICTREFYIKRVITYSPLNVVF